MAKEKDEKKMSLIVLIGGAILMVAVGFTINEMTNRLLDSNVIEIQESASCEEAKLYYEGEDFDIYTYCLDSIKIAGETEKVELKDLFKMDVTLDNLFDRFEKAEVYKDGGSTMYKSSDDEISILKCNTIEGNNDIYIGKSDMQYEETFCKNSVDRINKNEFEVDFEVLLISPDNDEAYKYLTLSIVNVGEVKTVRVKADDIKNIKKKGVYTFEFKTEKTPIKGDIESIFENAQIVSIKKVD